MGQQLHQNTPKFQGPLLLQPVMKLTHKWEEKTFKHGDMLKTGAHREARNREERTFKVEKYRKIKRHKQTFRKIAQIN